METNETQRQTIRDYLLGDLVGEQQTQFEERLLASDTVYEELVMIEDELIDEYLHEGLSARERESFESHFLAAPEHQEKLRFARTFTKYVTAEGPKYQLATDERVAEEPPTKISRPSSRWFGFLPIRNPIYGYALTAALVLVVVGVTWLGWRNLNSGLRDPGRVHSVVLTSGLSRDAGDESKPVTVPADTDTLRLRLLLDQLRHNSYEATLDAGGRTLTSRSNLPKEVDNGQPAVVLDVPARLVPAGDYRVKLGGVNPDGNREIVASYSFRIQNP
ncbi:MAG TPA: hypothetical protein VFX97_18405 [Pyrinomonadaceae bacterium]|nr:hypothetical protein [Pyrinomonadaceae bacterium]